MAAPINRAVGRRARLKNVLKIGLDFSTVDIVALFYYVSC